MNIHEDDVSYIRNLDVLSTLIVTPEGKVVADYRKRMGDHE